MRAHKHSSISSSDGLVAGLVAFALTLTGVILVADRLRAVLPDFFVEEWDFVEPLPSAGKWYLAYDQLFVDHYILYNGFGETIDRARSADVLIVGNSIANMLFPSPSLERFRFDTGFHAYNLGLAHAETVAFTSRLIERHTLAPQVVVVGADRYFYDRPSRFGEHVISVNRWDARKTVFEHTMASRVRNGLFDWLPRLKPVMGRDWPVILYRSTEYGSWHATREMDLSYETAWAVEDMPSEFRLEELQRARAFRDSLERIGAELVLLHAPFGATSRATVRRLADSLGVFAIIADVPGLTTRDHEHLTNRSGLRFASAALAELADWMQSRGMEPRSAPVQP